MQIWLRNLAYLGLLSAALPWIVYRSIKTGRYRAGLRQKLLGLSTTDLRCEPTARAAGPAGTASVALIPVARGIGSGHARQSPTIWLHGVSVGEVQLLAPLADRLLRANPGATCCISTTTDSGMELAHKLMPHLSRFFFPLDFSWAVRRTLRALKPSLIVLGELELWPNLIDCAHEMKIPVVVVNGRLSANSYRGYRRLRWLVRGTFSKLTHVAAQSQCCAARFVDCGCPQENVSVSGSLKFNNLKYDRNAPEINRLRRLVGLTQDQRVLVVGSTQSPEELAACRAFLQLRRAYPDVRLIVVPRHPDRFDEVHSELEKLPLRIARRTLLTSPWTPAEWDVLLVDTVGELKWWWGLADIAIVGGSFGKRGGQNMLEAAAYGANVAFGPNTSNFKDIAELLLSNQAAVRLPNLDSMGPWIVQQLDCAEAGLERASNALRVIADQQGAMQQTLDVLESVLDTADRISRAA